MRGKPTSLPLTRRVPADSQTASDPHLHMECCACVAQARTATYDNIPISSDPNPSIPMENRKSAPQVVRFLRKKRDTACIGRGHCAPIALSQLNTQNSYRIGR